MWELKLTSVVAMTMRKACRGKEFKFAKDKTRGGGRIYVNSARRRRRVVITVFVEGGLPSRTERAPHFRGPSSTIHDAIADQQVLS